MKTKVLRVVFICDFKTEVGLSLDLLSHIYQTVLLRNSHSKEISTALPSVAPNVTYRH
jgi:hypothetical protein